MQTFKRICVKGTAYECGKQIGEQAEQEIHHSIKAYEQLFMNANNTSWDHARIRAAAYIPWIEKYDPLIIDEMKGISDGAKVDFLDIVALNARSEIMSTTDGCTSLAAVPPGTKDNQTLLAQNWDWMASSKPSVIIVEIIQPSRPKVLMCTEAGIVGKIGMNDCGIGFCLNFLSTTQQEYGVPVHIVFRGILNSTLFSQAVGQISRLPRGTSANFLIATSEGEVLDIESTCDDYDAIYPSEGIIVHSNHFYGPKHINIKDLARKDFPDTHFRQGRGEKLLKKEHGKIDVETVKSLLSDHLNYPDSICRHGETLGPLPGRPLPSDTVFSIIMNLTDGYFELAPGQPCQTPFEKYTFTH
ncbi:C45 family peptidase [Bacillus sp. JJ1764]|uniref:C45 family peptidase n=1 Tax=Bacillus sp. JJ1764 TaxID=3122964 RepID=UPI002FFFAFA3